MRILSASMSAVTSLPSPRRVQGTYYTLMLGNTLAASFIWGINTLFLLDAGLSNLEAFAANAFFTAGMLIFEIPTGVVADTVGRRASYLIGTVTLAVTTALYWLLWVWESPFWAWAIVSVLLGLGFTFFSGAVDAWLVDALRATGYPGSLETVFGRAQIVGGIAMLSGSVLGGVIAQATNLGVPFVIRALVLVVMFVVAALLMHDLGFTPERGESPIKATRTVLRASIRYGLGDPPVRWLMLASPFTAGVGIYVFYALQPYLLELWGDTGGVHRRRAGRCAGVGRGDRRRGHRTLGAQAVPPSHVVDPARDGCERARPRGAGPRPQFLGGGRARRAVGHRICDRRSGAPRVPQRHDPVQAARHRALLRLADGLRRRSRLPAGARAGGRHRRLWRVAAVERRDLRRGRAVRAAEPRAEVARRHGARCQRRDRTVGEDEPSAKE